MAAFVVVLPGLAALLALHREHWYPAGDMAQAELHMRGFWSHPPLVGAAGRIASDNGVQGSHPGPALWVAMYPVYLVFGRTSFGLMAAVWSTHLAAAWLTLWLAARRSLGLMACLAITLLVVFHAGGTAFAVEPWNPWLAVLPFAAMLMAAWLALEEDHRWSILAAALGSYCVQCHVGYLPVVGACLATVFGVVIVRSVRRREFSLLSSVGYAVLVTVVIWLPPVIDQLRRSPGNLSILYQHFVGPREAYLSIGTVVKVIASELSIAGPWATGPALVERNKWYFLVTLALWASAVFVARRRRDRSALWLQVPLAATLLGGMLSVTRIFGGFQEYTIRWFWILTATIVATSAWTLLRALPPSSPSEMVRQRVSVIFAALGAVAFSTFAAVAVIQFADRARLPGEPDSRLIGQMVDDAAASLDRHSRYLVRWYDPGLGSTGFGLVLELERRGFTLGVDPASSAAALPHRVMPEPTASSMLYIVFGHEIERFRSAGWPEIAHADVRTPTQRARFDELERRLRVRLTEIGHPEYADNIDKPAGSASLLFSNPPLPRDIAEMVAEYVGLRAPAGLFVVAVGTVPPEAN